MTVHAGTMIAGEEFTARRARAAAAAKAEGLDGLLVCSRGGGCVDRYADVFYLTHFYTAFPYTPDLPGHWNGRAHAFVLLTADGDATLISDVPADASVSMPADRIREGEMVYDLVAEEIRAAGLADSSVGVVGADTMPWSAQRAISQALPSLRLVEAQRILNRLRARKSPAEIEKLREASALGSRALDAIMEAAVPGARHGEIVAAGMQVLLPPGGILYNNFMASGQGGPNRKRVGAAFPTWGAQEPLAEGDWFRSGISGALDGYIFDLARACPVGRHSNRDLQLFEAAIEVVEAAIAVMRPGVTADEVTRAALERQKSLGFDLSSVFSGMGHGIGLGWDEPWLTLGNTDRLEEGMVLSVERTVKDDGHLGDFEETVVITADGAEKITDAVIRRW